MQTALACYGVWRAGSFVRFRHQFIHPNAIRQSELSNLYMKTLTTRCYTPNGMCGWLSIHCGQRDRKNGKRDDSLNGADSHTHTHTRERGEKK